MMTVTLTAPGTHLNLGSGFRDEPGSVSVDIVADCNPDVVHDLREAPWPFADCTFSSVSAFDILEHLPDTLQTLEELYRICRPGAVIEITTPHFTCSDSYTDPTHCHHFGYFTFDTFTGGATHNHYTDARFAYRSRRLFFQTRSALLRKPITFLANRWPKAYERQFCWMFPAAVLRVELVVCKESSAPHPPSQSPDQPVYHAE